MRQILILAAALIIGISVSETATAQGRRPAAASASFSHSGAVPSRLLDAQQTNVRGAWAVQRLWIGSPEDFTAWERGDRARAPIEISFADTSSPIQEDEGGLTSEYSVRETVQPTSYRVTRNGVAFSGRSRRLGQIRFTGRFLTPGRTAFEEGDAVLTGDLTVGRRTFRNVPFDVAAH